MRNFFVFILFALFISKLYAQTLPTPMICAVTVDTSINKPVIIWKIADTSQIDGFIIKRIIFNGSGVVNNTLNNIAVINNPADTLFLDTTTTYSTQARPDIRSETYVVTAFKKIDNQTVYSNFSNYASSLFLKAKYDSCSDNVFLSWHTDQKIRLFALYVVRRGRTELLQQSLDTQFVFHAKYPGQVTFYVKAFVTEPCSVPFILSNAVKISLFNVSRPLILRFDAINSAENPVKLFLSIKQNSNRVPVSLFCNKSLVKTYDSDFFGQIAVNCNNTVENQFKLVATSVCNVTLDSAVARNVLLKANYQNFAASRSVLLRWNRPEIPSQNRYIVLFSKDNEHFTSLTQTSDTLYVHNLGQTAQARVLPGRLFYQILAVDQTFSDTSYSNIVELDLPPVIIAPNTIAPLSPNPKDRVFRPYVNFISNYSLTIYAPDGQKIFYSADPSKGWDGSLPNGRLAPQGSYLYVISYTFKNRTRTFKGSVAVIY